MKRLLLDQGLAPLAAALLRQFGFDAVHVSELGMAQSEDQENSRIRQERFAGLYNP